MSNSKILCISDIHGDFSKFDIETMPDTDFVLVAGDFTNDGVHRGWEVDAAKKWMAQLTEKYGLVYYVCGNHDWGLDNRTFAIDTVSEQLDGVCFGIEGLESRGGLTDFQICGSSLSPCFDKPILAHDWCRMSADREVDRDNWRIGAGHDIILSHCPPYGLRDTCYAGPIGSPGLRDYIERCQPTLVVCGHVHEAAGFAQQGKTLVVNCARSVVMVELESVKTDDGHEWSIVDFHFVKEPLG